MSIPWYMLKKTLTDSGVVCNEACLWGGYLIGLDGANDQEVTLYDNASEASGEKAKPTQTIDGGSEAENGVVLFAPVKCTNGLYYDKGSSGGSREITVYYLPQSLFRW